MGDGIGGEPQLRVRGETMDAKDIALYSVIPGVRDTGLHLEPTYPEAVRRVAELAGENGFAGTLLHTNFHALDPWMLAPTVMAATDLLVPLVALQPNGMSPHVVARMLIAAAHLHGRRIDLNIVAGATSDELRAIGDDLDHDARYARAREFLAVLKAILEAEGEPVDWQGDHYRYDQLQIEPAIPSQLRPRIFVAGSSPAGVALARDAADVAVAHPPSCAEFEAEFAVPLRRERADLQLAIRIGVVARERTEEAWATANERFQPNRLGEIKTARKTQSESTWVRTLAQRSLEEDLCDEVFWLGPYRWAMSYAPYLVGSYDAVAAYLGRYARAGVRHVLLDGPFTEEEFAHTAKVFTRL
jgi:alkanesulfonate monooxygenase